MFLIWMNKIAIKEGLKSNSSANKKRKIKIYKYWPV